MTTSPAAKAEPDLTYRPRPGARRTGRPDGQELRTAVSAAARARAYLAAGDILSFRRLNGLAHRISSKYCMEHPARDDGGHRSRSSFTSRILPARLMAEARRR